MPLASDKTVRPLAEDLLSLPTGAARRERLRAAGLLNAQGLDGLLDRADGLLSSDPGQALALAGVCADLAAEAGAPAAVPRAAYVTAGAHGIDGDFDAELRLTAEARDGYLLLGKNLEALRTDVGRMGVLLELGLYPEALDVGRGVLDALDGTGEIEVSPSPEESGLLTALVHQNLGGCLEYMGRYDEALDAYAIAEGRYRDLGADERVGEILDNRGGVLLSLGRAGQALAAHEAAAAVFEKAGLTLRHAKALANVGEASRQLADYARALGAFERARKLYGALDARPDESLLLLDTANAYLELNLYPEALANYEEAAGPLDAYGMTHNRARALWGLGATLVALSRFGEAAEALAEAATLFGEAGNAPLLSGVTLETAVLQNLRGDQGAALETATRALVMAPREGWPVQHVHARMAVADLLLPDAVRAEPHLIEARRCAERLALPQLRYRLNERLGRLRRLQGREEEARLLLEAAVGEIERLRGTVGQDAVRASFLRDKTAAYEELLSLHLARGDEEGGRLAFAVAERARSRALADLLVGLAKGPTGRGDAAAAAEVRKLQADLNATYGQLLGGTHGGRPEGVPPAELRGRAVELERRISRLRLRAPSAKPDPFAPPPEQDHPQDHPAPDVPLLSYHAAGDEIVAFVVAGENVRVARGLGSVASVANLLRQLEAQWDYLGVGPEFARRNMAALEGSARRVLAALYDELVEPVEGLLREVAPPGENAPGGLAVVPHGPLHGVPFHALFDGEKYLLDRFVFSYAPSARVHALLQERTSRASGEALVVSVADARIPAVDREATTVSRRLAGARVLRDGEATAGALRDLVPGRDVVHIACHGLFRADNPMFSSLKLHDGWLTATEVMELDLDGSLVTLSACESGINEVFAGGEIIGLTRAFLGAGASTLVSSMWLVQDETTADLMDDFYARLRDREGPAAALRGAQLALREEHPHPHYWAPFVLVGRR